MLALKPEDYKNDFQNKEPLYKKFTEEIKSIVIKLFDTKYYLFESRTKKLDSFIEKIYRDGKNYTDPFTEVTDISGIRIIVPTINDMNNVEKIIRDNFKIDENNCVNKLVKKKNNEFGYLSNHLIVSLNKKRLDLEENKKFKDLKCEIQIRTYLDHAWASIEHKINYKSDQKLPDKTERRLFSLSALLEIADREFQSIMDEYEECKVTIDNLTNSNELEFTSYGIQKYLESEEARNFYAKIKNLKINRLNLDLTKEIFISTQFFNLLDSANIHSFEKFRQIFLDENFKNNISEIINVWSEDIDDVNLKFVLNRVTFVRWQIIFSLSESDKQKIVEKDLITDNMKHLIQKRNTKNLDSKILGDHEI